jgi:methylenetetrahydrofolate reductase (NADPH)
MVRQNSPQVQIADVIRSNQPALSFEFFPPKTQEGSDTLFKTISDLTPLEPAYVSVTYGAGGSTRQLTHDLVVRLAQELGITIVAHLTCVGASKDEIKQILERYAESGIHNIMALRGDPPKRTDAQGGGAATDGTPGAAPKEDSPLYWKPHPDGFLYAADLVAFIKKHFPEMGVGVAGFPEGHPATPNRLKEIDNLKAKVDSGADYICTQMFFDNHDFYDYKERCALAGIHVPIIAGIMPITSRKGMQRMAEFSLGSRFPAKLLRALARAEDDEYAENVGIHWATENVI